VAPLVLAPAASGLDGGGTTPAAASSLARSLPWCGAVGELSSLVDLDNGRCNNVAGTPSSSTSAFSRVLAAVTAGNEINGAIETATF
jgi:hypothetical protein